MRITGFVLLAVILTAMTGCKDNMKGGMLENCHSHNDYYRQNPFYDAYGQRFGSIEADVFCIEGELYVAHDRDKIEDGRTLKTMYLEPIKKVMKDNGGSCYGEGQSLRLLIDLKTGYRETLPVLIGQLNEYGENFDAKKNPDAVKVVVSGSMPPPAQFGEYSGIVWFDGRPNIEYSPEQLERVAMISASFSDYSRWNGNDPMSAEDSVSIKSFIDSGHEKGKIVRFWGCPDTELAWRTFLDMGVDVINTDRVAELGEYMRSL